MDFYSLRSKGYESYQRKDPERALKFYDRALRLPKGKLRELEASQHDAVIHLNKAEILLGLERFVEAELEAKKAKETGSSKTNEEKSYYRLLIV